MHSILRIFPSLRRQRNKISLLFLLSCQTAAYSQNIFFTSNEIGVSKIDTGGMMSRIVWTKSKVAVLMSTKTESVSVFVLNASNSEIYKEVKLLKTVETSQTEIRTFGAINRDGDECILILTRNKQDQQDAQLRIYMIDKVYIYNFVRA